MLQISHFAFAFDVRVAVDERGFTKRDEFGSQYLTRFTPATGIHLAKATLPKSAKWVVSIKYYILTEGGRTDHLGRIGI